MSDESQPGPTSEMPGERIQGILTDKSRQISVLAGELSASYEKEIRFLTGMMRRDRQLAGYQARAAEDAETIQELKELRGRHLKKIWWLESELNRQKDSAREAQQLRERLTALQRSPFGRLQRRYWKLRSRKG